MSKLEKLKFSEDHQWIRVEENEVVIGMTDFAQDELGDIVFVELPSVGADVKVGEPFGSVESVKTVSELYAPVSGKVIEVNEQLESAPEKVNQSCYDDGWMIKVKLSDRSQLDNLWSYERYKEVYSEQ